ncbi:MAG: YicC family protein [Clostridiaceae bacterium]|nr:YicC family protein [Clostridiaceae bacterium]
MIRSMTGYGYYKYQDDLVCMDVEIKTVNHRYCDIYIRMPRQLSCFEDKVRSLIMNRIYRGKVDVFLNWENLGEGVKKVILDKNLALEYYNAMSKLAEELQLRDDISSLSLARFPEILRIEKKEENSEEVWSILEQAVNKALDVLIEMREAEGEKLKASLVDICNNIENYRLKIKEREPLVVDEYKEKLTARIQELMTGDVVDQSRLAMEVAIFADKCSIDEELVRLKSHIDQFMDILTMEGPVGRKLDFLLQEMNREVNTIGAKANDLNITKNVIELKSEIEKIREQIQNVE